MGHDLEEVRAEAGGPLGGRAFLPEGDTSGLGQVVGAVGMEKAEEAGAVE